MPQVQSINPYQSNPDPTGVEQFFSKLGKDYKDKSDRVEIGNLIGQYQQNREDANAWEDLQLNLAKSNVSPTKRLEAQAELNAVKKNIFERDKALNAQSKSFADVAEKTRKEKALADKEKEKRDSIIAENKVILKAGGKTDEEIEELAPKISTASARSLVKPSNGPKEKFETILAGEAAKEVPKLEQTIAKGADTLDNIATIEKLASENLSGLKGYGKALFNTEAASQLATLGATNLDTVIKLFNPAGTLPTAKLNWIKNTFSVSPWDNLSTIQGKLNTQKIVTNQSIARAKERVDLLKQYNGNIPSDVSKKFDKETGDLLDILKDQYEPKEKDEKKNLSSLPPAKDHPDRTIQDDATGQRFKSINGNWVLQ